MGCLFQRNKSSEFFPRSEFARFSQEAAIISPN